MSNIPYQQIRPKVNKLRKLIPRLFRLGITGLTMLQVVSFLKANSIDYVVDIRESTFYKSKQGFAPQAFQATLEAMGIKYEHNKVFGNPFHKEFKKKFESCSTESEKIKVDLEAKEKYLNYLDQDDKNESSPSGALSKLFYLIAHSREFKTKRFCFVCYCKTLDPLKCHTYWIIEKIINLFRQELGLDPNYTMEEYLWT